MLRVTRILGANTAEHSLESEQELVSTPF
jgi:hypothetical protein